MKTLFHQLEQYLQETVGIRVDLHPWEKSDGLPQFLPERYRFLKADILGTDCLFMIDAGEDEQTPGAVSRHLDQVRDRTGLDAVYVRQAVTSYGRKRLIERKVPFIVPGNQLYLPMLAINLREHLKRLRKKRPIFSPSTQMLILYVLFRKETGVMTPADMAHRLGYSAMTMTRAFDELETAGIGEQSVLGKERHLLFRETGKPLWEKALPYLNTPVRKRRFSASLSQTEKGILAGESALARYTALNEPEVPVFAFPAPAGEAGTGKNRMIELSAPEPGDFAIESWKYDPALLACQGRADRLSLYLSMRESPDERIQSALDELLRGMEW
jgi:DNA-binding MarR family transcriptional regulator